MEAPKLINALNNCPHGYLEVIGGTLRNYDLFHAYRQALKIYAPHGYITKHRLGFFDVPKKAKYDDAHPFWYDNDAYEVVIKMHDALDALSPEGWYFGTPEGDASCFGWWQYETEEQNHTMSTW